MEISELRLKNLNSQEEIKNLKVEIEELEGEIEDLVKQIQTEID